MRDGLGISEAVLARRLRAMVDANLLEKVDYRDGGRTRQGYAATDAAVELLPVLQQLVLWGEKHTATPASGGHLAMIHESCGTETTTAEFCSECGERLVSKHMTWVKPWSGAVGPLLPAGSLEAGR